MIGYVYVIRNKVNNKKYIGSHHSDKLDLKYFGSGPLITAAVEKYGKDLFELTILRECDTEEDLVYYEEYYINYYNAVESKDYYNMNSSGYKRGILGYKHTEETKLKISKASKNNWLNPEYVSKMKEMFIGENNPFYGCHHSEETRLHLKDVWDYDRHISDKMRQKISNSLKGRHHSEETRLKISLSNKGKNKGRKTSKEVIEKIRQANILSWTPEKRKNISEKYKRLGIHPPEHSGDIWVCNQYNERHLIKPNDLLKYLDLGYIRGKKFKCKDVKNLYKNSKVTDSKLVKLHKHDNNNYTLSKTRKKRKPISEETRFKMRQANLGGNNPIAKAVVCIDTGVVYDSILTAAHCTNIHYKLISRCCNNEIDHCKNGLIFKFLNNDNITKIK